MPQPLIFRENGTFTIVQFTDIHWKDNGERDQSSRQLMEDVLDHEQPDLVVFTGDVIYTGPVSEGSPACTDAIAAFQAATQAVAARGIPWAAVFGNHDTESLVTREELLEAVLRLPHTVTQRGPVGVHGAGNYSLTVQDPAGQAGYRLFFFDSGAYSPLPQVNGYDWLRDDQIAWYREESRRLQEEGGALPALAFFHIPLPEYQEVWETRTCYGHMYETKCFAPEVNSGMFTAMLEMGDVVGTFVGHDHVNDFWGDLHGIRLCYGRATGYNTYGKEGFPRGARVIRLWAGEREFETWLRLADGTSVHQQPEHLPGAAG
ncbi:metallophosphoesterase family protein [Paenibacillus ferrarius]|uniref:metallophosphoesterase family protein n=1 Tax=Paenibacillus ferrarius TaxID=1469647 RepID=UPI003D2BDC6A